ncbi:MAG: LysR substrate-binding domain-containing protein [Pseudomonas sp.]
MADLNSLAIFAKVVESNSFSEAARRLKMPISTVSRRIAELEDQLGVRLLERSTHSLRPTAIGDQVLDTAQRCAELNDAVETIVSNQLSAVAGILRISAPPSISDTLLAPIICAFQSSYPNVRVQMFITDRYIDHIIDGIDLAFRIGEGALKDSSLVSRKVFAYRRRLVSCSQYLSNRLAPTNPQDLLDHRLLAFSRGGGETSWTFYHINGTDRETIAVQPVLATNDYAGILPVLLSGGGIADLPPLVAPELMRTGQLVEVMSDWRFEAFDFSMVHLGSRHMPKQVQLFKELVLTMAPTIFHDLPT